MQTHTVITSPVLGIPEMTVPDGESPGLYILAMGDLVRQERERLGLSNPLAPVIVREWQVTELGTFVNTPITHTVYPQPADPEEEN